MARWFLACLLACHSMVFAHGTATTGASGGPAGTAASGTPMRHKVQFRRFTMSDGLPSRRVRTLAQDPTGYLWVGTDAGLARFDGTDFDVFRREAGVPGSIAGNRFDALLFDTRGRLWAGGRGSGLSRRHADGSFTSWRHVAGDAQSLVDDDVQALAEGADGRIWIGTRHRGLLAMTDGQAMPQPVAVPPASVQVNALHVDRDGRLWVGGERGLERRDDDGRWTTIALPGQPGAQVNAIDGDALRMRVATDRGLFVVDGAHLRVVKETAGKPVATSLLDSRGTLWIAMVDAGLLLVTPDGLGVQLPSRPFLPQGLPGRSVVRLVEDREGGIWSALSDGGLAYVGPGWGRFFLLTHVPDESVGLPHRAASAVAKARDGQVWVGGTRGWIVRISLDSEAVRERLPDVGSRVHALLEASDGQLWIGTARGLMVRPPGDWTAHVVEGPQAPVTSLVESPTGLVYAGTRHSGIWEVPPGHSRARLLATPSSDIEDDTRQLLMVGAAPWRAGSAGIQRLAASGRFELVPGVEAGAADALAVDGDDLWVARADGLQRYRWHDGHARKVATVGLADGWPRTDVLSIGVGPGKLLWGTGVAGLWVFAPTTGEARTLGLPDGLFSAEFIQGDTAVLDGGITLGATIDGVLGFDPAASTPAIPSPPVVVRSASVRRDGNRVELPLDGQPLFLGWRDRELTIEARALSFIDGDANRYRFRLEGVDESWVDTGQRGYREITPMSPGRHRLFVQAAAPNGPWGSLDTPIDIVVERPPWTRPWAWAGYLLAAMLCAVFITVLARRAMDRRMQVRLAGQARVLAEEANEAKSRFIGVLGHELRTPMTGVLGMAELLQSTSLDAVQAGYVHAMRQSGKLLLRLLDNVLDLARLGLARLELENAAFDPAALIIDTIAVEQPLASARGLRLVASLPAGGLHRRIGDEARVRQVLLNLLSNAVKFTEHGHVTVTGRDEPDALVFAVADTGPGIDAADHARLFQRYEQARTPQQSHGIGVGLAICRELVGLMGGSLELASSVGHGATFTVRLPLVVVAASETPAGVAPAPASTQLRILLVEDDLTVAEVIGGLLRQMGHEVTHAAHALAAMGLANEATYDVAILDLDLPHVDGFSLAQWIGQHHPRLPMVAVTARAMGDEENRVAAAGMQAFARKPVDTAALQRLLAGLG